VVKVVILAIQQSTQLMVPILPTQLGHVWCRLHITRCGSSKKSYRPSGQSGHFGNTKSTPLMVPILPTQLGHVWCRLHIKTRCGSSKKSYRPSGQSGHFGNTTINSVNGADIANTVEVMYGVDCI
jgi:hypothetical protein